MTDRSYSVHWFHAPSHPDFEDSLSKRADVGYTADIASPCVLLAVVEQPFLFVKLAAQAGKLIDSSLQIVKL
jgi:hypothetical protein